MRNTSLKIGVACIIMKMSAAASTTIAARKIMLSSALMKKHMIMLQMEHQRRPHRNAQDHLIGVLHIGYIGGHTGHQSGCTVFINIRKGKGRTFS